MQRGGQAGSTPFTGDAGLRWSSCSESWGAERRSPRTDEGTNLWDLIRSDTDSVKPNVGGGVPTPGLANDFSAAATWQMKGACWAIPDEMVMHEQAWQETLEFERDQQKMREREREGDSCGFFSKEKVIKTSRVGVGRCILLWSLIRMWSHQR